MTRLRTGFVVYAEQMIAEWEFRGRPGYQQGPTPVYGAYVAKFERDHLNGSAHWGDRRDAVVYKELATATAVALAVSDHEGVGSTVVRDARSGELVDSPDWVPRNRAHVQASRRSR